MALSNRKIVATGVLDGTEIRRSPVELGSLWGFCTRFIHPRWCRILSIISMDYKGRKGKYLGFKLLGYEIPAVSLWFQEIGEVECSKVSCEIWLDPILLNFFGRVQGNWFSNRHGILQSRPMSTSPIAGMPFQIDGLFNKFTPKSFTKKMEVSCCLIFMLFGRWAFPYTSWKHTESS